MLNLNDHMSKPEVILSDGSKQIKDLHMEDVHFGSKQAIMKQLKKGNMHHKKGPGHGDKS